MTRSYWPTSGTGTGVGVLGTPNRSPNMSRQRSGPRLRLHPGRCASCATCSGRGRSNALRCEAEHQATTPPSHFVVPLTSLRYHYAIHLATSALHARLRSCAQLRPGWNTGFGHLGGTLGWVVSMGRHAHAAVF